MKNSVPTIPRRFRKNRNLKGVLGKVRPETVWDLGANTGEFSKMAASHGAFVVSLEQDPACTEQIYRTSRQRGLKARILPLTVDLANPSPGLGWGSRERMSLQERGPGDLVLALALVHHLVLSSYIPMEHVACWFSEISKNLIVEFVPAEDPMVTRLLSNRPTGHLPYDLASFQECFRVFFATVDQRRLSKTKAVNGGKGQTMKAPRKDEHPCHECPGPLFPS